LERDPSGGAFLDYHHAAVLGGLVNLEIALIMQRYKDQHILVMGLGSSGLAMARWCAQQGAQVTVADTRQAPPGLAQLQAEAPTAVFRHVTAWTAELLEGTTIRALARSPGLLPTETAELVSAARTVGLPVWSELDLFNMALIDLRDVQNYYPKVLAITGTNGKTTVTSLTGQLVERSGKTVAVAGNIGPTLLDTLSEKLNKQELPQVWVLELSSFQLDGVEGFMPSMGTVLNLTQDHLDWHGDMQAYGLAKARIFGSHSLEAPPMLLNRDDPSVLGLRPPLVKGKPQRNYISFGGDLPQRPGDYGLESVGGMTWLVRALEADETQKRRREQEVEIHIQRLMPADALRIRGKHNALNALAALALASAADCPMNHMLYGLREYRGEPHRVEPVAVIRDVEYLDDSKGTNVGATVAALAGIGSERKIVVILGGEGKGQDFSPLAQPVALYARAAILIGRDAHVIEQALSPAGIPMHHAKTLEQATVLASELAQPGDAVLLSPACASFDMFKDYAHRAEVFCSAVEQLANDAGTSIGAQG
jgi:UDP-N-acetylmuramoylalanine--D-glutamate ligase